MLLDSFRKVIALNEGDGDSNTSYRFSDPDGIHSGKSGWSFGLCQFDLLNNPWASIYLLKMGFSEPDIAKLKGQTTSNVDMQRYNAMLLEHRDMVDQFDNEQLQRCLDKALGAIKTYTLHPKDDAAVLSLADYDNQYSLSYIYKPGYLVYYLGTLPVPFFTALDTLNFKLNYTKYGKDFPNDCKRRYNNILKVMEG